LNLIPKISITLEIDDIVQDGRALEPCRPETFMWIVIPENGYERFSTTFKAIKIIFFSELYDKIRIFTLLLLFFDLLSIIWSKEEKNVESCL